MRLFRGFAGRVECSPRAQCGVCSNVITESCLYLGPRSTQRLQYACLFSAIDEACYTNSSICSLLGSSLLPVHFLCFPIPSIILARFLSPARSPDVNSDPGSLSRLFSPLPTTVRAFMFIARRLQLSLPSSTRIGFPMARFYAL